MFTHFFPIGSRSFEHFLDKGVSPDKMTTVLYSNDTDYFQRQVEQFLPQRDELRRSFGINPKDHVFIYCGKMFRPKNPLIIPAAFALVNENKDKIWLLAVGAGELQEEFEKRSRDQLGSRALFVGFKNQSELGRYYAAADTLILPSQSGETWGLVVNEALQFGLGVIASDKVGCAVDLVARTGRGRVFPSGSAQVLAECISDAVTHPRLCEGTIVLPTPSSFASAICEVIH